MSLIRGTIGLLLACFTASCGISGRWLHKDVEQEPTDSDRDMHLFVNASQRLVVLGDSVASGMFANTTLGKELSADQAQRFLKIYRLSKEMDPHSEAFYVEAQKIGASPDDTAFAGIRDYSFSRRMEASKKEAIGIDRYAVSGATTDTMKSETARLNADQKDRAKPATLVVLHIGANDFCDRTPLENFKSNFRKRLSEILGTIGDAPLLILGVPDVPKILSFPDQVAFDALGTKVLCSDVRQSLKMCGKRDIAAGASDTELAPHEADVKAMNDAMVAEIDGAIQASVGKARIKYKRYESAKIEPSMLAIDCFHPSMEAQSNIAAQTWPVAADLIQ